MPNICWPRPSWQFCGQLFSKTKGRGTVIEFFVVSYSGQAEAFSKWGGWAPKTREILGEYGGMLPEKIFESRVSEMPFWGEILENSQDCKILRTARNGSFNISLTLITGIRSFLILSLNDAISYRERMHWRNQKTPITYLRRDKNSNFSSNDYE